MIAQQLSNRPLILCGEDSLSALPEFLRTHTPDRVLIVCDSNTRRDCLPILLQHAAVLADSPVLELLQGEEHKSLAAVERICDFLLQQGASRKSLLLNLGGGIVGDVSGFAASIFMRGIAFIQIPTTVLSMVDASVGGKTGVNFRGRKNLLGAFQDPLAVLIYPTFIKTLPVEERVSGFAEMIKHALLDSRTAWEQISTINPEQATGWDALIARSVKQKKQITDADFKETGPREQLNLGHTMAHAFEALALERNQQLLHGQAVAAGLFAEILLSEQLGLLTDKRLPNELKQLLDQHYTLFKIQPEDIDQLLLYMGADKKNSAGKIVFSLLASAGHVLLQQQPDEEAIRNALITYSSYA
jgi:3-dehydroquinate synthase